MNFSTTVKEALLDKIEEIAINPERFCRNPHKDFTRKRKLSFSTIMRLIISMESGTIRKELLKFFKFDENTVTSSAFVQQRDKILPDAFEHLFHTFNSVFPEEKRYCGYRLLACDGTKLLIPTNPKDVNNYLQSKPNARGYNSLLLNACYDLCNRRYVDAIIQPGQKFDERRAMVTFINQYECDDKTIYIADRGFESYNLFAHAQENHKKILMRVKDITSRNGILKKFPLPNEEEFDIIRSIEVTHVSNKMTHTQTDKYRFLAKPATFDYFSDYKFYPLTLRIVRFLITENTYESIITNPSEEEFSTEEIKKIYSMRWGIETSFRALKYSIGLASFHAKKEEYIKQEIFARLVLYNFCEIITTSIVVEQKERRHSYQLNYALAIHICRCFLRFTNDIPPFDVEALIQKNLLPIRPERKAPRNVKAQAAISFIYRVA